MKSAGIHLLNYQSFRHTLIFRQIDRAKFAVRGLTSLLSWTYSLVTESAINMYLVNELCVHDNKLIYTLIYTSISVLHYGLATW